MKKQKKHYGNLGNKLDLDIYIDEDKESDSNDFNILIWWRNNTPKFFVLSKIARDVLAILMSSVESECTFSSDDHIFDPFRSPLTPNCEKSIIYVQD